MLHGEANISSVMELSGMDFRRTRIHCGNCSWRGTVGELSSVVADARSDAINYCCPDCEHLLARHPGLTHTELMLELDRIRSELAEEYLNLRLDEELRTLDPEIHPPEFIDVRQRFFAG